MLTQATMDGAISEVATQPHRVFFRIADNQLFVDSFSQVDIPSRNLQYP
jgi:hypothetical protein